MICPVAASTMLALAASSLATMRRRPSAAHRHLLGIGAAREHSDQLSAGEVHDADAIRGPIRRRQRLLVDPWSRLRRTAQRDIERASIRADGKASRPFSEGHRRDHGLRGGVDDRQIARVLVRDVQAQSGCADGRRDRRRRRGRLGFRLAWRRTAARRHDEGQKCGQQDAAADHDHAHLCSMRPG